MALMISIKPVVTLVNYSDVTWASRSFKSLGGGCFIQQLVPVNHNRIIKGLHYWCFVRWLVDRTTINTTNHLISLLPILSVMDELPCQWFYTTERKAVRAIFKQLLQIIPVSYIFDLLIPITSTGSADAQLSPAWHHWHTQGCIPTGVFDRFIL